jgi:succinyl-CoA synthetase beta subunit/citryl-CoA synthetase large subunit
LGRLLENHSKLLLKELGITVPCGEVVEHPAGAAEFASQLDKPVVLKALVPVGKRGKAGAVKFAASPQEAKETAADLLGMKVGYFPVKALLVEEMIPVAQEWYVSITYDKAKKVPVIIAGVRGGIEVEELSRLHRDKITVYPVDPLEGLYEFQTREIWAGLGVTGSLLGPAGSVLFKLYDAFQRFDAYLLEINPLVVTTNGTLVAASAVMSIDDSAVYRQNAIAGLLQLGSERAWRPLTDLERKMVDVNEADPYRGTARYTEMPDGNIGFLCGGGGGSLLCFDALLAMGGRPANYSEIGGNPPEAKVYGLTRGILSKREVKGLFVAHNITNNTQVDIMANGIVSALRDLNVDPVKFPVVVREAGVNDTAAREIFLAAGVEYYSDEVTLAEAAARMVARMKEIYGGEGGC